MFYMGVRVGSRRCNSNDMYAILFMFFKFHFVDPARLKEMSLTCRAGRRLVILWEPFSQDNMNSRAVFRVGQQSQHPSLSFDLEGVSCPESCSHGRKMVSLSERQARSQEEEMGAKCLQHCWPLGTRVQFFRQDGESGCICESWEQVSQHGQAQTWVHGKQDSFSISRATFVLFPFRFPPGFRKVFLKGKKKSFQGFLFSTLAQNHNEKTMYPWGPGRWQQW